jgi:Nuclease-related domain
MVVSQSGTMFAGLIVLAAAVQRERGVNYARRQQYRRLSRAGAGAAAGGVAVLVAIVLVSSGAPLLGCFVLLVALGLGLYSRHWLSLARRSWVGARSEDAVQRALAPLQAEGWRLRHSLPWQGQGDIDSGAIAPTGIAVAVETKTRNYDGRHLARVREQAAWLSRRRRRWARNGALGVMCVVRARGVERVEHDVLVVSIDRLTHVVRVAAGMDPDANSRT